MLVMCKRLHQAWHLDSCNSFTRASCAAATGVRPMSALPGPRGLPVIGNLTQMLSYRRPQTHILWTTWAKQYGLLYRYSCLHHSCHWHFSRESDDDVCM